MKTLSSADHWTLSLCLDSTLSNGEVIGVNSASQATLAMVSPLCFKWYWAPLSTFASIC